MFENSAQSIHRFAAQRRSLLLKTVGYRVLSVIVTAIVAFVVLRDAGAALDVGIWANAAKMGVYYAYEQAWSGVDP